MAAGAWLCPSPPRPALVPRRHHLPLLPPAPPPAGPHPPGFRALPPHRWAAFLIGMVFPMFESFKVRRLGRNGVPLRYRAGPAAVAVAALPARAGMLLLGLAVPWRGCDSTPLCCPSCAGH